MVREPSTGLGICEATMFVGDQPLDDLVEREGVPGCRCF